MGSRDVIPTLREIFDFQQSRFLAMGMSLSDFWDGDPQLAKVYLRANQMKRREAEDMAWRQGLYTRLAIVSALDKDTRYPDYPFPLTKKEQKEQERAENEKNQNSFIGLLYSMEAMSREAIE